MSGLLSSSRHSATRRFSPPDSVPMSASHGGRRSASAAISSCRSVFSLPAAAMIDFQLGLLGRQLVEVGIGLGIGRIDLVQPRLGGEHAADALLHRLAHRLRRVELRLLRQVADVQPRHRHGLAFDVLVQAGHDLQQRGLAAAVEAEHADLRAGEEGQADVLQDLPLRRHDLADAVHGVDVLGHGGGSLERGKRARRRQRETRYCRRMARLVTEPP